MDLHLPEVAVLVPIIEWRKFASLSGIPEGVFDGHCKKGLVPTVQVGKYRCVDVVALSRQLIAKRGDSK